MALLSSFVGIWFAHPLTDDILLSRSEPRRGV